MGQPLEKEPAIEMIEPDISHIITEDDEPVDNIFSEKQQRLLTESLNTSWRPERPFLALANVGIFYGVNMPPIVPDMFLSMDVKAAKDIWKKKNRSYFIWQFGKPPEVVVEVVSNKKGGETDRKLRKYEQIRVAYYIIFDPQRLIQKQELRIYEYSSGGYIPKADRQLTKLDIGVTLWDGVFDEIPTRWLRWCDHDGNLIPTGLESTTREKERADQEKERANQVEKRAHRSEKKAELLAAKLRSLGIDPETIED